MGHVILHDPVAAFLWPFWGGIPSTKHLAAARLGHGCAEVASTELSEESSGALEEAFGILLLCF